MDTVLRHTNLVVEKAKWQVLPCPKSLQFIRIHQPRDILIMHLDLDLNKLHLSSLVSFLTGLYVTGLNIGYLPIYSTLFLLYVSPSKSYLIEETLPVYHTEKPGFRKFMASMSPFKIRTRKCYSNATIIRFNSAR